MPVFKPFNSKLLISKSDLSDFQTTVSLEDLTLKQNAEWSFVDLSMGGNIEQLKFIYELASDGLSSRPLLVRSISEALSCDDSFKISRYCTLLTKSVKQSILSLERSINSDLFTDELTAKYGSNLNLGDKGVLSISLDIGIGTDHIKGSEVRTDFFGARTGCTEGSYFDPSDLSRPMTLWVAKLIDLFTRYGFGFCTISDASEFTGSYYYENLSSVYSSYLTMDTVRLDKVWSYMEELSNHTDCDELFSLDRFCELFSESLIPFEKHSKQFKKHLKFKEVVRERKRHQSQMLKSLPIELGDDYGTFSAAASEFSFMCFCDELSGYNNFTGVLHTSLKVPFEPKSSLASNFSLLLDYLPDPITEQDLNIVEYVTSIKNKIPKIINKVIDKSVIETPEVATDIATVVGLLPAEYECDGIHMVREHLEMLHQDEHPYSYVRDAKVLPDILKEQFVINSILTSVATLAYPKGNLSFW